MSKTNCKRRKYVAPQCKVMLVEMDRSVLSASGNTKSTITSEGWEEGEDEDLFGEELAASAAKDGLWTDED